MLLKTDRCNTHRVIITNLDPFFMLEKVCIRAKTLHSPDKVEKEIMNMGVGEVGKTPEFVLRNLHPGSTYNVSITTAAEGEYVVAEPRIVVETDTAASVVFQPLKHLGNVQYQIRYTPIEGPSIETKEYDEDSLLRYLVVVDSRQSDYSSIDITKLADKAASDYDNTPYYITASLSPEQVHENIDFRLGDGVVHGGYLNYPLKESQTDPRWTLVPMSQVENEILEPRLKTCGFTEEGNFECDMPLGEFISYIPLWIKTALVLCFSAIVFCFCVMLACGIRRFCENPNQTKESSIMYYHNDSPNTQATTREYRKVERREFRPADMEARMRFLEE
ncbi:hypothetical protein TELCIR_03335 [Teladorsagia circumcincta]|uniref:Fibronectin type III domain protein n=1 Tax=Teladorsagia circumcincta TaxID=45464 RepID=A0A2G9UWX7_TELCI|nr:hypothetical protein TELCIR_03335 [Teladorsagia circumcincta]